MSHSSHIRICPRCEQQLVAQDLRGQAGLTRMWQCACGWASARTVAAGDPTSRPRHASGTVPRVYIELAGEPLKVRN